MALPYPSTQKNKDKNRVELNQKEIFCFTFNHSNGIYKEDSILKEGIDD